MASSVGAVIVSLDNLLFSLLLKSRCGQVRGGESQLAHVATEPGRENARLQFGPSTGFFSPRAPAHSVRAKDIFHSVQLKA